MIAVNVIGGLALLAVLSTLSNKIKYFDKWNGK